MPLQLPQRAECTPEIFAGFEADIFAKVDIFAIWYHFRLL